MLIAVGPLTNVAMALRLGGPALAAAIPKLVVMGGGHGRDNASGSAEFNIWSDPEAAELVFSAGIADVTLVQLNATHDAVVRRRPRCHPSIGHACGGRGRGMLRHHDWLDRRADISVP